MSQPNENAKRARIRGIILGVLLAVVCHMVPPEYQAACKAVSEIATIGSCGV
jgi:hypothetical protein